MLFGDRGTCNLTLADIEYELFLSSLRILYLKQVLVSYKQKHKINFQINYYYLLRGTSLSFFRASLLHHFSTLDMKRNIKVMFT